MIDHLLEASGIRVAFDGRQVLSDAYLRVRTGEIVAIVGRNGQGKSTMMKAVYGTLPSECSVHINGVFRRRPYSHPELLRYLPQFSFSPPNRSVGRLLSDFQLSFEAFYKWFPQFREKADSRIGNLSGGWIRILETFAILCADSHFVMLDEPFSHVSPLQVEILQQLIREERSRKGIVLTDHLLDPLLGISDVLYMLGDGNLRRADSAADLVSLGYRPR